MIVDTLMIILVYDTWLYDDEKKSYSISETGENSATQGEVRQNKVRPQWVNGLQRSQNRHNYLKWAI